MNRCAIVLFEGKLRPMNRATRRARRYDEGGKRGPHIIYYPMTDDQINEFQK